jgi:carboxymethylenebutenolidase
MNRIAAVILLAVSCLAARPAVAQTPPPPPEEVATFAAEELVLRLAPYVATQADLPEGVRLAGLTVDTPATLAPLSTPPDGDPRALFATIARTLVLRIVQTTTSRPDGPPNFAVTVQLMTDADAARAFVADPARRPPAAEVLDLARPLGESRIAWRVTRPGPAGAPLEDDVVRWQRGQLVFEVAAQGSPGRVSLDDALAVASRIDARATPLDLTSPPVLTPYVTEAERLEAAPHLQSLEIPSQQVPAGYRLFQPPRIVHPAEDVLGRFLIGDSPQGVFDYLREQRPVLRWSTVYAPTEPRDAPVFLTAWLTADPEAADRQLAGLVGGDPRAEVVHLTPPLIIGDGAVAGRSRTPDYYRPGDDLATYTLGWKHGPLVLQVVMEGQIDEATAVAFAQALEAAYAASAFPVATAAGTGADCVPVTFDSGGEVVRAELCRPKGEADGLPTVVVLHGCDGPPDFRDVAQAIAAEGFVTLYIDYFSRTPGVDYCTAADSELLGRAPVWLEEITDGATFLQRQPGVVPERLGLVGHSLGSIAALVAAVADPRYRAVVEYSGLLAPLLRGEADRLPPVLIQHGDADRRIDVAEAHALRDAIEAAGGEYELAIYPGGGHSWPGEQGAAALARTIAFLRRHLGATRPG